MYGKIYFIRTDQAAIERGCVGYGWQSLNFSEFALLSDLLSAWKNLPDNDNYNWQQERQIVAFYTLSKGDIVIATARNSKEIYIGTVKGDRSYEFDFVDGWAANLITVDFVKDTNGNPKAFSRKLLSDALCNRLGVARFAITDLQEYQDEIVAKLDYLQNVNIGKLDDNRLIQLAKLCDLNNQRKLRILTSLQEDSVAVAKLLIADAVAEYS